MSDAQIMARLQALENQVQCLKNQIRWNTVTAAGEDDPTKFAVQQVEYLGKAADSTMVFPYGLHGNVPAGAFGIMFSVQDNPDNRATIAWTPKDRPQLKEGEVAFYHPPTDAFIIWTESGNLEIETGNEATGSIFIDGSNIDINVENGANIYATDVLVSADTVEIDAAATTVTGTLQVDGLATLNAGVAVNGAAGASVNGNINVTGNTVLGTNVTSNGVNISDTHEHTQGNDSAGNTEQNTGPPQ